ncbi:PAS domain-containing protein [Flavobacterium sp. Root901]|uniref:PAS domain-containing protein n=1 Tax=Flavobacterium sp. Root901 TaxID=1736605 RepID=UPI003977394C
MGRIYIRTAKKILWFNRNRTNIFKRTQRHLDRIVRRCKTNHQSKSISHEQNSKY